MSKVKAVEFNSKAGKWTDTVGSTISNAVVSYTDELNKKAKAWTDEEKIAKELIDNRFIYRPLASEINALRAKT